jgi:hypothetical protein
LSHSTSCFCVRYFKDRVSWNYLPRLALNHDLPDLCLLSSKDYRSESLAPGSFWLTSKRQLWAFLLNSVFGEAMLLAWHSPWWLTGKCCKTRSVFVFEGRSAYSHISISAEITVERMSLISMRNAKKRHLQCVTWTEWFWSWAIWRERKEKGRILGR